MKRSLVLVLGLAIAALAGCKTQQAPFIDAFPDNVNKPLPPDEFGLFKLDPKDYPDMRSAFVDRAGLERAIDKSIQYMNAGSSRRFFPSGPKDPITHDQVLATLLDFKKMINTQGMTPDQFQAAILARYEVWASKGYNWDTRPADQPGEVWFTGYYTPIYQGSRTRTSEFAYPIYSRPGDLVSDPITGDVQGQKMPDGSVRPYPTRRELTAANGALLKRLGAQELLWFRDPMEPYIIQVQGSAKVNLTDGQTVLVGYAGKNGRDYKGLGSQLLALGELDAKHLSLPAVLEYFKAHPEKREEFINNNDSFAFLKFYEPAEWPSGSLGVQVTPTRSLATDKKIFPRAAITFVTVDMATAAGGTSASRRFLCDQDTGGAIRAAGRGDIYMGIGEEAGQLAGRQFAQGHLFYLVLKPTLVTSSAFPALTPATRTSATRPVAPKTGTKTGSDEMFPK